MGKQNKKNFKTIYQNIKIWRFFDEKNEKFFQIFDHEKILHIQMYCSFEIDDDNDIYNLNRFGFN